MDSTLICTQLFTKICKYSKTLGVVNFKPQKKNKQISKPRKKSEQSLYGCVFDIKETKKDKQIKI